MFKTLLAAITVTALLVSSALPAYAEYYHRGGGYGYGGGGGWHGGPWNGGDGAHSWSRSRARAAWRGLGYGSLLSSTLFTQHPATPLFQSPPPLGTGAIHISNLTHM